MEVRHLEVDWGRCPIRALRSALIEHWCSILIKMRTVLPTCNVGGHKAERKPAHTQSLLRPKAVWKACVLSWHKKYLFLSMTKHHFLSWKCIKCDKTTCSLIVSCFCCLWGSFGGGLGFFFHSRQLFLLSAGSSLCRGRSWFSLN